MRRAAGLLLAIAAIAAIAAGIWFAAREGGMTLADFRDIVVIAYGVMGVLLLTALIIAVLGLWIAVRALTRTVRDLLEDPVRPALDEVRQTAANVRGASEFIADSTVHPLIRTLSFVRGARRGIGALAGLRRRSK